MGEAKRRQEGGDGRIPPKAHHVSEINVTLDNGIQIGVYCIKGRKEMVEAYAMAAEKENGILVIETGSDTEASANAEVVLQVSKIAFFGISDVKQPSSIITMKPSLM